MAQNQAITPKALQTVHFVHKERYDEHGFAEVAAPTEHIEAGWIRVQPTLTTLTSNNLSYCAIGTMMHLWSAFEAPPGTPEPFNDPDTYGIAPAWGYGRVVKSGIQDIGVGSLVSGFVPTSQHTFDLQLQKGTQPACYSDVSDSRAKMMSLYKAYTVLPPGTDVLQDKTKLWKLLIPVWEAGYLLANQIFPARSSILSKNPIHPFGIPISPWTAEMADMSGSLLIAVASGTKTARAFLEILSHRAASDGLPKEIIEVTEGKGLLDYANEPVCKYKTIKYEDIPSVEHFATGISSASKVVTLDFGGRDGAAFKIWQAVKDLAGEKEVIVINIGGEAKVQSLQTKAERMAKAKMMNAVRMNTSTVKDVAMKTQGEAEYIAVSTKYFADMVQQQSEQYDGRVLGVTYHGVAGGLRGTNGLEGAWDRVTSGQVRGDGAWVYTLEP